jgi:hypothetical protein
MEIDEIGEFSFFVGCTDAVYIPGDDAHKRNC